MVSESNLNHLSIIYKHYAVAEVKTVLLLFFFHMESSLHNSNKIEKKNPVGRALDYKARPGDGPYKPIASITGCLWVQMGERL